ncbi:NIPSNAP family protein [Actinomadura roseirufa]|uniref:NIPSNAP family protein n=1 Tax=Actinomadura roseirufa TaxID=2094049 RepID=UPI001A955250|nr:NIPSNAP family protein [Actinomadura roseirufa]
MNVIELRQYRMRPGRTGELVELFEREFVEPQEAAGMTVLGQFRDLDDPHRFVWLRGFADMTARGRALPTFYDGPVWAAHRDRARATMADSSDARLLRPLGAVALPRHRPPVGAPPPDRFVAVTLWSFRDALPDAEPQMREKVVPLFGPSALALASLDADNNFPRLPVRTGDGHVAVITRHPGEDDYRAVRASIVLPEGIPEPAVLRLAPTPRSLLR